MSERIIFRTHAGVYSWFHADDVEQVWSAAPNIPEHLYLLKGGVWWREPIALWEVRPWDQLTDEQAADWFLRWDLEEPEQLRPLVAARHAARLTMAPELIPDAPVILDMKEAALQPTQDGKEGVSQGASGTVGSGQEIADDVSLDETDLKILGALASRHLTRLHQYQLEQLTGLSRGTIGPRLAALREHGLTHRPNGERGGEAITQRGLTLLALKQ